LIDYPTLKTLTDYWWRVKTCAHQKEDAACGDWVVSHFKTFKPSPPTTPSPKDGGELSIEHNSISWNSPPGTKKYSFQYKIKYLSLSPEEKDSSCPPLVGKEIIQNIINSTSTLLSLKCLGEYQWSVRACLDEKCSEDGAGEWANWRFSLVQPTGVCKPGLVPCGRTCNIPETPWDERDPCQIKHLFLLLRNILDFLFWRVGSIILVLLVIITGIIYYFSVFSPEILGEWAAIANVRRIWKSAGIGYGIIFLAWLIINLFLAIIGYKFQIFGHWWEIKF
jgi:hypothetical protein